MADCRNPRVRKVIKFLLLILYAEKPKRCTITMANTIFGALSKARLVNWGRLTQNLVEKSIPHIGKKTSFLSPYLLHLYHRNGCVNEAEEDALTLAEDEVKYRLALEAEPKTATPTSQTEAGTERFLSDPAILEFPPVTNTPT